MLDLDVLLLGLVGAGFLVTGGVLLRSPAIVQARFLARRASHARDEALANAERSAAAIRVAEAETARVRGDLQELQRKLAAEQQRSASEAEPQRKLLEQQAADLKAALAELAVERELSQQLEQQCDETRTRLREVQDDLRQAQSEAARKPAADPGPLHALEERFKTAEHRTRGLELQLRDAENKLKAAETRVKDAEGKLKDAEGKLKTAEAQPRDADAKVKTAEARQKTAEARVRELETRLKDAEGKLKAADVRQKDLEGRLKAAEEQLQQAKNAPAAPSAADSEALEAAQNKISALERMLEGSRARARDLQKELSTLKEG